MSRTPTRREALDDEAQRLLAAASVVARTKHRAVKVMDVIEAWTRTAPDDAVHGLRRAGLVLHEPVSQADVDGTVTELTEARPELCEARELESALTRADRIARAAGRKHASAYDLVRGCLLIAQSEDCGRGASAAAGLPGFLTDAWLNAIPAEAPNVSFEDRLFSGWTWRAARILTAPLRLVTWPLMVMLAAPGVAFREGVRVAILAAQRRWYALSPRQVGAGELVLTPAASPVAGALALLVPALATFALGVAMFISFRLLRDFRGYEAFTLSGVPGDESLLEAAFGTGDGDIASAIEKHAKSGLLLLWPAVSCMMAGFVAPTALARTRTDLVLYGTPGRVIARLLAPFQIFGRIGSRVDNVLGHLGMGTLLVGSRVLLAGVGVLMGTFLLDLLW